MDSLHMDTVGVDISSDTEGDRVLGLLLHWVSWLVPGLTSSQGEKLMSSDHTNLTFSVIPIALTDEKSRSKLTGLGISSNAAAQPSKEF